MDMQILKSILNDKLDSGVSIVTWANDNAHIANTWLSYIQLKDDKYIYIPVAGMTNTEKNLEVNNKVLISITNRELQGKMMPGTGVIVHGIGSIIETGSEFTFMKEKFDWIRAVLKVDITDVIQTI